MTDTLIGPAPRGPRGYPGLYPAPAWFLQTWPKDTATSHLNCIWYANKTTAQEPAFAGDGSVASADWDLWIDGRGAEAAGAAVEDAAGYAQAAHDGQVAAETARDAALAAERRIRAQDLGDFADDASAIAWAAAQTPAISIFVGSSYWNTTTEIKRICSATSPAIAFVNEDADAQTQRTNAGISATAAANVKGELDTRFLPAASSDPTYAGDTPPWVVGARYLNTLSGKERIWQAGAWHDVDEASVAAAANALASSTSAAAIAAGLSAGTYTLDGIDAQRVGALASFPKGLFMLGGVVYSTPSALLAFSSAAKYTIGPDGKVILNAANGPAYTFANGRRQLLIEPLAATNYWLNSESNAGAPSPSIYTAAFTAGMFGAVAGATITSVDGLQHNMTSPSRACADGETDSFDFLCLATADISGVKLAMYGSIAGFGGATQAGYDPVFKILSGPGALAVASGVGTLTGLSQTVPTRVRVTRTFALAQTVTPSYSPLFTAVNQTFKIGAFNFQQGYGSSYIPCGATATARAADVVTAASGLLALCNGPAVTIVPRGKMLGAGATLPYNIMSGTGGGDLAQLTKYGGASYGTTVLINQTGSPASMTISVNANDATADFAPVVSSMIGGKRKLATRGSAVSSDNNPFFKGANTGLNFGSSQSYFACAGLEIDEIVAWPIQGSDAGIAAQSRVYA